MHDVMETSAAERFTEEPAACDTGNSGGTTYIFTWTVHEPMAFKSLVPWE